MDGQGRIPTSNPRRSTISCRATQSCSCTSRPSWRSTRIAADHHPTAFAHYPRNADGGFWHADWARHQMWVDGVFMGEMFEARYGAVMHDRAALRPGHRADEARARPLPQAERSAAARLGRVASASWADKRTGLAPEVWSEGPGVVCGVARRRVRLSAAGSSRPRLPCSVHCNLCEGLKEVQDPRTGMWCQVVDKPRRSRQLERDFGHRHVHLPDQEAPSTRGYIDRAEYLPVVAKAYKGIIKQYGTNQ